MTKAFALTRRQMVRQCTLLPLASLSLLHGCNRAEPLCADPAMLGRGEEQMRKTREYAENSSLENQNCENCEFFSADSVGECGYCEILDGAVSRGGHCTSWSEA